MGSKSKGKPRCTPRSDPISMYKWQRGGGGPIPREEQEPTEKVKYTRESSQKETLDSLPYLIQPNGQVVEERKIPKPREDQEPTGNQNTLGNQT